MGTAKYMSPEQFKGKVADRTADVWAFGCVVYEMMTGHTVFDGETAAEIVVAITKAEPDWTRLPLDTPVAIYRLLRRCLEKDPRQRLQPLGDARIEISDALVGSPIDPAVTLVSPRRLERIAWLGGLLLIALTTAFTTVRFFRPVPPTEMRLDIFRHLTGWRT